MKKPLLKPLATEKERVERALETIKLVTEGLEMVPETADAVTEVLVPVLMCQAMAVLRVLLESESK